MSQLAQLMPTFRQMGVNAAAITLGKPGEAKLFCAQRSPDLHCLSDPHQLSYSAFGIGRLNLFYNLIQPQTWIGYLRTWRAGHHVFITDSDMLQLSATFVVDAQGVVRFAHYNRYTADHPDWDKVQAAAQSTAV